MLLSGRNTKGFQGWLLFEYAYGCVKGCSQSLVFNRLKWWMNYYSKQYSKLRYELRHSTDMLHFCEKPAVYTAKEGTMTCLSLREDVALSCTFCLLRRNSKDTTLRKSHVLTITWNTKGMTLKIDASILRSFLDKNMRSLKGTVSNSVEKMCLHYKHMAPVYVGLIRTV